MAHKATALKQRPGAPRSKRRALIRRDKPIRAGARMLAAGKSANGYDVDEIFERVRNAVLDQRLPPGMQLKEQLLANAFKVNRPLIRQVLTKLQNCHLVVHRPNRGVFVATPSIREGRDIFLARQVIECAVIELLVDTITPTQIEELETLVAKEQAAYQGGELRFALRYSIEFHRALARLAGNLVLQGFLEELVARTPLVILAYKRFDLKTCGLNEHSNILAALAARDKQGAAKLMRAHIHHLETLLDLESSDHPRDADIASLFGYDSFS
jgi:DNA-binding GntR family transcriptional regulator